MLRHQLIVLQRNVKADIGSPLTIPAVAATMRVFLHHEAAMQRREFIAGVGFTAILPIPARAQRSILPVIGILGAPSAATYVQNVAAVHQGLKEVGYVEDPADLSDVRIDALLDLERAAALLNDPPESGGQGASMDPG